MSTTLSEARARFSTCEPCETLKTRVAELEAEAVSLRDALSESREQRQQVEAENGFVKDTNRRLESKVVQLAAEKRLLAEAEAKPMKEKLEAATSVLTERIRELEGDLEYYCDGCETVQKALDRKVDKAEQDRIVEQVFNEHHPANLPVICTCEGCEAYRRIR